MSALLNFACCLLMKGTFESVIINAVAKLFGNMIRMVL